MLCDSKKKQFVEFTLNRKNKADHDVKFQLFQ